MVASVVALLCLPAASYTAPVTTFQAGLVREIQAGPKQDRVTGNVFFSATTGRLLIEVVSPLHQWVVVTGKEMLLYYPERRLAFRVISRADTTMPFFQVMWNCFKEDFDLARQGYTITKYERRGTTLVSTWKPPASLASHLSSATLEYEGNKLLRVEHKTARGNVLTRAVFGQHVPLSGYFLPLEVSILYGSRAGSTEERVTYANPRFNHPLPPEVVNFEIPSGTEIKEIVW